MSKTVTLRVAEPVYEVFRAMAERENRPLSNFIETAVLRYLEEHAVVDEFEMREISENRELNSSLLRGHADAKAATPQVQKPARPRVQVGVGGA